LGDIDSGYKFGQLALNLLEIYQAKEIKTKVYFLFNNFVRHWKEHIINVAVSSSEEFKTGLETGDIEYTCYCAFNYCNSLFWSGENLEVTITSQVKYINTMLKFKQYLISDQTKILNQVAVNLVKISPTPCKLAGESFDEEKMLPNLNATNSNTVISQIYLAKLILCCFFRNYNEAIKNAQNMEKYKDNLTGLVHAAQNTFYSSLAIIFHYPHVSKTEQKQYLKKVASHQKQMKTWAHHAPMNFQHKYDLVEAEKARVLAQNETAIIYYERAIKGAKEQGFIQEEALANECAAEFYLALGREKVAKTYMIEAYYCYIRWGAVAKVRDLEETYPRLISRTQQLETVGDFSHGNSGR
jgi:hypothetical protein